MTRLLNDFQKMVGKDLTKLSTQEFTEIINDSRYVNFYVNNAFEILVDMLDLENIDKDLRRTLWEIYLNLLYKIDVKTIAAEIDKHTAGEISDEDFMAKCKEYFEESEDPVLALLTFITVGSLGIDIKFAKETVISNIKRLEELFMHLTPGSILSFSTRNDYLTLLYNVKVEANYSFGDEDILKDFSWVKEAQEEFDKEIAEVIDALPESEAAPEELGLIDITKLKNKKSLREEVGERKNDG